MFPPSIAESPVNASRRRDGPSSAEQAAAGRRIQLFWEELQANWGAGRPPISRRVNQRRLRLRTAKPAPSATSSAHAMLSLPSPGLTSHRQPP